MKQQTFSELFPEPESEEKMRIRLASYLKTLRRDQGIIYRFDLAGLHLQDVGRQVLIEKLNGMLNGFPDLWILTPVGKYCGLLLELKRDCVTPRQLEAPTTEHGKRQLELLKELKRAGYAAAFGIGFEGAKRKILDYLSGREVYRT